MIMDNYEQKYKDALEKASIAYKDEDKHLKATLERIFPELKRVELTAKELMIGDYVIRKNVPKEILIVDAIDSIRNIVYLDLDGVGITEKIENIEPISLTIQILEKNGFVKTKNGVMTLDEDLGTSEIHLVLVPTFYEEYYWWAVNNELTAKIKYVHELQHILKLVEIKKEIKL